MIEITQTGGFKNLEKFLSFSKQQKWIRILNKYGKIGAQVLANATPVDSGKTAASWDYEIYIGQTSLNLYWINTNINKGVNIAVILQYGHGTRTGGYVEGRDYINPAIRPVFDKMTEDLWKEVTSA